MRISAPLAVVIGCLSLVGCGAPQDTIQHRLFASHNVLGHAGFNGLGPISSGVLEHEQSQNLSATLERDACYVLAAFGSSTLDDVGLTVVGPDESPVAEDRSSGRTAIVSFCTEQSGEHIVTIAAESGSGSFQMAYWFGGSGEEGDEVQGNGLTLGRAVQGTLAPGQRTVDYSLQLRQQRSITIDLESRDFDTYLFLLRDGNELERNDDGGNGLNSRISTPLAPGTYTVRVGSFGDRGAGPFTLVVR